MKVSCRTVLAIERMLMSKPIPNSLGCERYRESTAVMTTSHPTLQPSRGVASQRSNLRSPDLLFRMHASERIEAMESIAPFVLSRAESQKVPDSMRRIARNSRSSVQKIRCPDRFSSATRLICSGITNAVCQSICRGILSLLESLDRTFTTVLFRNWRGCNWIREFAVSLMSLLVLAASAYGQSNAPSSTAVLPTNPPSAPKSASQDSLFEIIFSGGFMGILIMIVLIVLSVVAVYLIFDQAMGLRRKDLLPNDLIESVRQLLAQGKLKEADQLCRERPCPLSFVLVSGMAEIEFGWPAVEKALEDATAEQAARLYRKLEYLSVIGNLAPMLGLLGTVTGMILAFREVAVSSGSAGAGELASGIYSALVTTVAGLVIAIPALGAFAIFRNKIDELISEIAYSAQHVFASVRRRLPGVTIRPAAPPRN